MKIKQTITTLVLALGIVGGALVYTQPVLADDNAAPDGCGGAPTAVIKCSNGAGTGTTDNGVWSLLLMVLNILTAGIGIVAVGGIAYGAALYASSGDKPEQAKQGMTYIRNVVIGLVAYGLMFAILNFIIPGGIFA
jgi:hypothetical protein